MLGQNARTIAGSGAARPLVLRRGVQAPGLRCRRSAAKVVRTSGGASDAASAPLSPGAAAAAARQRARSPSLSMDASDLFESMRMDCPFEGVQGIISQAGRPPLLTATPKQTLQAVIPSLQQVTGLPVVDASGRVVGVISRKDIIEVRKAGGSLADTVSYHMTAPALTVPASCSVQQAADLMLARRIRRLPVVDAEGKPLGVVSRSDVFRPLMQAAYDSYMRKEAAAVATGEGIKFSWAIKYLYDGDCSMCLSLKAILERQDRQRRIRFVNIADMDYDPNANMGIEFEEAMDTIHAVRPDGSVLLGTDALRALFDEVGLGWAVRLSEQPLVARLFEIVYDFLSANRIKIGGWMDGVVAVKRLELSKKEINTCGDVDEGCLVEW